MARLSVEQFIELRKMAALDDIRDCVDTIDALERELAEAKRELDDSQKALFDTQASHAEACRIGRELQAQLAHGPCGKHRMCDWVVGYTDKKFLDAKEGDPGYKDTISMYYCLSCEREADERNTAVQAFGKKLMDTFESERAVYNEHKPLAANTFRSCYLHVENALAPEGGDALPRSYHTPLSEKAAREGKEPK